MPLAQHRLDARHIIPHQVLPDAGMPLLAGFLQILDLSRSEQIFTSCRFASELLLAVMLCNLPEKHLEAELEGLHLLFLGLLVPRVQLGGPTHPVLRCLALVLDEGHEVLEWQFARSLVQHEVSGMLVDARSRDLHAIDCSLLILYWKGRSLHLDGSFALPLLHFTAALCLGVLQALRINCCQLELGVLEQLVFGDVGGGRTDDGHRDRFPVKLCDIELQLRSSCPVPGREERDGNVCRTVWRYDARKRRDLEVRVLLKYSDLELKL
mmetsp:Transcript_79004/g.218676  ORF Transcript_79004/g.218676 Transcript_79004/m.218676 type:complete len:267 (+) Transcript_79004:1335-2135(+)